MTRSRRAAAALGVLLSAGVAAAATGCAADEGIGGPRIYSVTYRLVADGAATVSSLEINDGNGDLITPPDPLIPYSVTFPASPLDAVGATASGTATGTVILSVNAVSSGVESVARADTFVAAGSVPGGEAYSLRIQREFLP